MTTPFRILVVEDEPVIRELVRSLLSESDCEVEASMWARPCRTNDRRFVD